MVAGTSGATPGSWAGDDDDEPKLGRLMPPPQAPKVTVSAEMTARLAIVRGVPKLAMVFPRIRSGRTRHTANRKTAVGATTTRSPLHYPLSEVRATSQQHLFADFGKSWALASLWFQCRFRSEVPELDFVASESRTSDRWHW